MLGALLYAPHYRRVGSLGYARRGQLYRRGCFSSLGRGTPFGNVGQQGDAVPFFGHLLVAQKTAFHQHATFYNGESVEDGSVSIIPRCGYLRQNISRRKALALAHNFRIIFNGRRRILYAIVLSQSVSLPRPPSTQDKNNPTSYSKMMGMATMVLFTTSRVGVMIALKINAVAGT